MAAGEGRVCGKTQSALSVLHFDECSRSGDDGEERCLALRRRQGIRAEMRKQLRAQRSSSPQHRKQQPKGRLRTGACASSSAQSHGFDEITIVRTAGAASPWLRFVELELSKIPTIQAESRTIRYSICSLLMIVN